MKPPISVNLYRAGEAPALVRLFYATVHSVCAADYTQEQVDAWADGKTDPAVWEHDFLLNYTLVARVGGEIAGFAAMRGQKLTHLYVHRDFQRMGVGTALLEQLEREQTEQKAGTVSAVSSKTAKPFFERFGWQLCEPQSMELNGVSLEGFRMQKQLPV